MSIAVAHNETAEGTAALLLAADHAAVHDTELAVLHVFEGHHGHPVSPDVQAVRDSISETLARSSAPPVKWELHVATNDHDTAGAIVDLVTETNAQMLVVGSKRRTPVGKFFLGSTVQRLVLDAPVPVLVVKAPIA